MGSAVAAERGGEPDFVAIDMGGTSFDICLVRGGRPEIKTDWNWRYRYYIGLPMVDVQSVGAGGGSIARVRQGALLVGPESAGSTPGPACYGRGGERPTVTDADATLGYLPVEGFAGGRMTLDVDLARAAIERDVAKHLKVDVTEAAWGIERIVNTNMANATRRVLAGYGADPRELALIAYGGNGAVHAAPIAAELGVDRILVPRAAPAFSALGLLVADYVVDVVRSYVTPLSGGRPRPAAGPHGRAQPGGRQGAGARRPRPVRGHPEPVRADGLRRARTSTCRSPARRARHLDDAGLLDLADRFHTQHEADRGFAFRNQQPVLRGARLMARGETPKPEQLSPTVAASTVPTVEPVRLLRDRLGRHAGALGPIRGHGHDDRRPGPHRGAVHRRRRPARLVGHPGRPRRLRAPPLAELPASRRRRCRSRRRSGRCSGPRGRR